MQSNRFSPTKMVLVVVLIGGLYKVGTVVNEPPKGPPAPRSTPTAAQQAANPSSQKDPKAMAKEMKDRMIKQLKQTKLASQRQALELKLNHNKPLSHGDGITPVYFQETSMGAAGFAQTEKEEANKKRITDEVNKEIPTARPEAPQPTVAPSTNRPPSAAPTSAPVHAK